MRLTLTAFFVGICCLFFTSAAKGQIHSPQYNIISPAIGIESTDQKLQTTMTTDELKNFLKTGYIVKNIDDTDLRATLSHSTITFDSQSTDVQNIGTVMTISSSGNKKYEALLLGQHKLKTVWGDEIPDTNCDSSCTSNFASPWNKPEVTGFGYTLKGQDIPSDFENLSFYRKIADRSKRESAKTIMLGSLNNDTKQATIIFRLNMPNNQTTGTYETILDFFILPTY